MQAQGEGPLPPQQQRVLAMVTHFQQQQQQQQMNEAGVQRQGRENGKGEGIAVHSPRTAVPEEPAQTSVSSTSSSVDSQSLRDRDEGEHLVEAALPDLMQLKLVR
jgi:hypothetical protein